MFIPEVVELFSDKTCEGGADHGTGQGGLRDASGPEVNVIRGAIGAGVGGNSLDKSIRGH